MSHAWSRTAHLLRGRRIDDLRPRSGRRWRGGLRPHRPGALRQHAGGIRPARRRRQLPVDDPAGRRTAHRWLAPRELGMSAGREWRSDAACREMSGELFFPTATKGPGYDAQVAAAKAVCAGCRVRSNSLDEALIRIPEGMAGGL